MIKIVDKISSITEDFDTCSLLLFKLIITATTVGMTLWFYIDSYQTYHLFEELSISGNETQGEVIDRNYNRSACYIDIQFDSIQPTGKAKNVIGTVPLSRSDCPEPGRKVTVFYRVTDPSVFIVKDTYHRHFYSDILMLVIFTAISIIICYGSFFRSGTYDLL